MLFGKIRRYFKKLRIRHKDNKEFKRADELEEESKIALEIGLLSESYQLISEAYKLVPLDSTKDKYITILLNIADTYKESNNFKTAIKYYLKAIKVKPSNDFKLGLFFYTGYCYYELNQFQQAYNYFKQALLIDGNTSICDDLILAAIELSKKDPNIFNKTAKLCIQKSPTVFYPYVALSNNWSSSINKLFLEGLSKQNNTATSYGIRGLIAMREYGNLNKALTDFKIAKSMDPSEFYYHYLFVVLLYKKPDRANDANTNNQIINGCKDCFKACVKQGMSIANNNAINDIVGIMVKTFILENHKEDAINIINEILKTEGLSHRNKGFLYAGLANIDKHFDQPSQAVLDYGKAADEYPTAKTYKTLGALSFKLNLYDITSSAYRAANQLDKHILDSNDFREFGRAEFNLKKYSKALKGFKSANKLDPKNAEIYGDIGECLTKLHQYSKAMKYYQLALKYDTTNQFYAHQINNLKAKVSDKDKDKYKQ